VGRKRASICVIMRRGKAKLIAIAAMRTRGRVVLQGSYVACPPATGREGKWVYWSSEIQFACVLWSGEKRTERKEAETQSYRAATAKRGGAKGRNI